MIKTFGILAAILLCAALALPATAADYVGSEKCFTCHAEQFNDWQASGHPWKLRKVEKARYAKLPLPPGYSWDDISYVIGGATKKARFIDKKGYIITTAKDGSEAKTQYNLANGSWSFYHKGEKKPYKCGPCHMTNYSADGHQDGMVGMIGTWSEDGIGCEECHGPGGEHIKKPSKKTIAIDRGAEACGKCHQRGGMGPEPPAKGGFIRHHEQINELKAGVHKSLACIDCHNPHQRAILAKDNCAECHAAAAKSYAASIHGKAGLGCKECHMPKATKSAIAVASYTGDVRTHLFKINVDPKAAMFKTVTEKEKTSTFAQGYLTLEYACLACHGSRDKAWAAKSAKGFHKM
ncbi:cytochrome c3 family protein [uncultured Desulfuromonas sp.]|uniref:cytochrome c3 family protein n=1 Tax=uncultured Desulfuromonas sp. TaxID=181013 RepID=UPI002620B9A8|nr:cytochrome c3 family protein [uncultured Desulfuromonas sp.]